MPKYRRDRLYVQELTVAGEGRFPFDMLRYDTCVPRYEAEMRLLSLTIEDGDEYLKQRRIHLLRYSENNGPPTFARWQSFGWRVIEFRPLPA